MARFRYEVTIGEMVFHTIEDAARHFCISPVTFKKKKDVEGVPIVYRKVEMQNPIFNKKIIHRGIVYDNLRQLAKKLQLTSKCVFYATMSKRKLCGDVPTFLD